MPVEPEGALRAELMAQISGAQAALEVQLEALRHAANLGGDTASLVIAQNQLSRLGGLSHRIEHASGVNLAAIRAEVTASIGAAQAVAQQARTVAASGTAAEAALHEASAETRRVTGDFVRDFYERKIFDPYLRFGSPEEEQAYRERESAREKAIEEARARGTPEGELQATRLAIAQLEDAGTHGADASPDYQPTIGGLRTAERNLASSIERNAPSVEAQKAQSIADARSMDEIQASAAIDPALLAQIRGTGMVIADDSADHRALPPAPASNIGSSVGRG